MITLLLKSSLLIIVLLTFYKIFLEKESFFAVNRLFFMAGLCLAFALPFVPLPQLVTHQGAITDWIESTAITHESLPQKSTNQQTHQQLDDAIVDLQPFVANGLASTDEKPQITKNTRSIEEPKFSQPLLQIPTFSTTQWLLFIYAFGVLVLLLNFMAQITRVTIQILKNKDKIVDEDGIIVNLNGIMDPCSFFNYIFINPTSYDYATYEQIIAHEKIHVRKWHTVDLLLAELAIIILWFNPFIWWYRQEIEKNIEYQTDDLLLKNNTEKRENYQLNLLKIATYNKPLTVVTNYNQSLIRQRILKMNSKKSNPFSYWKYAFALPLIFMLVLFLNKPILAISESSFFTEGNAQPVDLVGVMKEGLPEIDRSELDEMPTTRVQNEQKKQEILPSTSKELIEKVSPEIKLSDCQKLSAAAQSGSVEKVREVLTTFNPSCLPYANEKDYENMELIHVIAKKGGKVLVDVENERILVPFKKIVFTYSDENGQESVGFNIKEDCSELINALTSENLEQLKKRLDHLDFSCLVVPDGDRKQSDILQSQLIMEKGGKVDIAINHMIIYLNELMEVDHLQPNILQAEAKKTTNFSDSRDKESNCEKLIAAVEANDIAAVKSLLEKTNVNCLVKNPGHERELAESGYYWQRYKAQTALVAAAREGLFEMGKMLVESGADVNLKGSKNEPALIAAAESGNTEFTRFLVEKGADLMYNTNSYGSVLNAAAREGHVETVKYLLTTKADINANSNGQGTPLNAAAREGNIEIAKLLLEAGADINIQNNGQGAPLNAAARNGHQEMMQLLIEKGADINAQTNGQGTALNAAARNGYLEVVQSLVEAGANIDRQNNGQGSALNAAARNGHVAIIKYLVEKGADIDAQTNGQGTALNAAARNGEIEIVKLLVDLGADLDVQSNGQGSALNAAARNGYSKIIKYLVEKGADIDAQTNGQGTALNAAARNGEIEIVKLLVDLGANLDVQSNGQGSALNAAARNGYTDVIKYLVEKGADINAQTNGQGTALNAAARDGHNDVIQLLIDLGADVNVQNNGQGSALNAAARNGYLKTVQLLLNNGAEINAMTNGQGTALLAAVRNGYEQVVKLLIENGADPHLRPNGQPSASEYAKRDGSRKMLDLLNGK